MASIRWVRPDLTTVANSRDLAASARARYSSAGSSAVVTWWATATWIAVGNTSLDDCDALTSSLGWTGRPRRADASRAMTSLAFMFELVPDPVW